MIAANDFIIMREMILQLHCFLCCKADKDRKAKAGFREMLKEVFFLNNLVIMYEGIFRMQIKISWRQRWKSTKMISRPLLEVDVLLLKPLCKDDYNELAANFSIHNAIKILSKLSVSVTAFSGVWKVMDQVLFFCFH